MDKPTAAPDQDQVLQEIIQRLPSVHEPARLEELSLLGLSMLLRRAESKPLKDELAGQIKEVVAQVKPGHTPEAHANEMRFAANACVKILNAAKERRLPRSKQPAAAGNWAQSTGKEKFHGVHHPSEEDARNSRTVKIVIAVAALCLAAGGAAWWSGRDVPVSDGNEVGKFVDQLTAAAKGDAPATHMFGGELKVTSMGGVPVVIARGVPPRICAASGMRLVKKGLLSVNDVTPTRVSSAIITELCNKDEGDATIMWAPK